MTTSTATKRALIGQYLSAQDKHLTEAVRLLGTLKTDSARAAIREIYMASHKGELARVEAGKI